MRSWKSVLKALQAVDAGAESVLVLETLVMIGDEPDTTPTVAIRRVVHLATVRSQKRETNGIDVLASMFRETASPAVLLSELRVAAFQVISDLVRLYLLLVEDLAHRTLHQSAKTAVSLRRSMLARMASQQSRRPQFVRIAQFLRLAAGQRHQPALASAVIAGSLRSRTVIESRHWTKSQRPLNAALHGLMMHPQKRDPPRRKDESSR